MNHAATAMKHLHEAMTLASEAIYLADAYAGGDSETAKQLSSLYDKLEIKVGELEDSLSSSK
jgi:hypothetical protein